MRFADGFAGAGGFRIALENLGHECIWSCENDSYARQVYRYHWKEPIAGDIRKVDPEGIPDFDLFCAGFPCQSFSVAGHRKGFADTRGTLFFEICKILRIKRPKLVLLENVKGILSHDGYRTFRIILESLRELGYVGQYQICNSKNFGVPQNRERVFIVGYLGDGPRPEVFPIREGGGTSKENKQHQMISDGRGHAYSLDCNYFKGAGKSRRTMILHNIYGGFGETEPRVFEGVSPAIGTPKGGGHLPLVINPQIRSEDRPYIQKARENGLPNPSGHGTLTRADGVTYSLDRSKVQVVADEPTRIRRLTPLECERLQGFPDNWTKYGITAKGDKIKISDTQRYKLMGNAVTIPVIEAIARKF